MQNYSHVHPYKLIEFYMEFYVQEYGQLKAQEIAKKIEHSNTVKKFLQKTVNTTYIPTPVNYLEVIHSMFYFMFLKAEPISMGATLLFMRWLGESGIPNQLVDESIIRQVFFEVIERCSKFKVHITGDANFFDKFNLALEKEFTVKKVLHAKYALTEEEKKAAEEAWF